MTLRDDINFIIKESNIKGFSFDRLTAYKKLLNRIADKFLINGRMDLNHVWLWDRFRNPKVISTNTDSSNLLTEYLLFNELYWFLASEEDGKYWVAESTGKAIIQIIDEMYLFEYYIVERNLNWILCENHHGAFIKSESA